MKTCNTCGKTKSVTDFHRRGISYQPKCKDCKTEWSKKRHLENGEHRRVVNAKWREDNPEAMTKCRKEWQEESGLNSFYRAWNKCILVSQSLIERDQLKEFYRNTPEGFEVDHIIPTSKGGTHVLANLQYLTIHDNRVKSNKLEVRL